MSWRRRIKEILELMAKRALVIRNANSQVLAFASDFSEFSFGFRKTGTLVSSSGLP